MDAKKIKMEEMDHDSKEAAAADHVSHNISYSTGLGTPEEITCDRAQTIVDALQLNTDKKHELVILIGKRAISSHFPCWLVKDDLLDIEYIKAEGNSETPKSVVGSPGRKAVIFHVKTEGGPKIRYKIMNNKNLKDRADEVSVYAFEGETIAQALERDGRFRDDVFSKYSLKKISDDKKDDRISKLSNDVKHLDGKTSYRIVQGKTIAPPKREPGPSAIPSASSSEQSATNVSVSTDTSKHTARQNAPPTLFKPRPIANSKEILDLLRAQFNDLVKQMRDREGTSKYKSKNELLRVEYELLRVEYGKSAEKMACLDVKRMKQVMGLADSVCQVRVEGTPLGSGFLLFDKFILTNAHVIESICDHGRKHLPQKKVTVSFCFEDLGVCCDPLDSVPVKQVVVCEYLTDHSGCKHDWALLELDLELAQKCPSGLLENVVTSHQRGGICIIGHPYGGVKKPDPCFIIPVGDREDVINKRCQEVQWPLITGQYFHMVNQSADLAYDSCFSYGSSGSPVFDEFASVVAMHTGGLVYKTKMPQKVYPQSIIEYAQPLPRILPRIIFQIVERERFDVLEAYLLYTSIHQNHTCDQVKEDVKTIVKSQNSRAFEINLKNYDGDSDKIKEFIKLFNSEPMEM